MSNPIDKPAAEKALVPIGVGAATIALLVVSVVVTKAFGDILIDLMLMAMSYGLGRWQGRSSR